MDTITYNNYKSFANANGVKGKYWVYVQTFLKWCDTNSKNYLTLTYLDFQEYRTNQHATGSGASHKNTTLCALKSFYKWLVASGLCQQVVLDELSKLKSVKVNSAPRREYLTKEEMADAIECLESFWHWNPLKTQAVLWFMFFTGVRKNELINLTREKIDLKKRIVILKNTKRNKDRVVGLPPRINKVGNYKNFDLVDILRQYFLLEPETRNAFNLSGKAIENVMAEVEKFATTTGKHITAHSIRHSFAHHAGKMKIGIKAIQKLLGHASVVMTERYYDLDEETILEEYNEKMR